MTQVAEMGFPQEACRKAVYHTRNAGLEPAMNWVMEHMDDAGDTSLFAKLVLLTLKALKYFYITRSLF